MDFMVNTSVISLDFVKKDLPRYLQFIYDLCMSCWDACKEDCDLIIQNPPAFAGVHIAERLQIPIINSFTMPWSRTRAYPNAFGYVENLDNPAYNYSSHLLIEEQGMWQPLRTKINKFRKAIDLPEIRFGGSSLAHDRKVPFVYCFSPLIVPKPSDWGPHIHVCGYFFLDSPSTWKPDPKLVEFISKKPKPIYIGFGSITVGDPDGLTNAIYTALEESGQRAVMIQGWGGIGEGIKKPDNVFLLERVPHDWLFPQMAGVVHHGGAGTVAAGLRAGVPTMVVPFFGDQMFWGSRVYKMGLGISPLPIKRVNAKRFKESIMKLVGNKEMAARCASFATQIAKQKGVSRAIDAIHTEVRRYKTDREEQLDETKEIRRVRRYIEIKIENKSTKVLKRINWQLQKGNWLSEAPSTIINPGDVATFKLTAFLNISGWVSYASINKEGFVSQDESVTISFEKSWYGKYSFTVRESWFKVQKKLNHAVTYNECKVTVLDKTNKSSDDDVPIEELKKSNSSTSSKKGRSDKTPVTQKRSKKKKPKASSEGKKSPFRKRSKVKHDNNSSDDEVKEDKI